MKKAIGILAALSICLLATTAFAQDTTTVKGFYDIGTVNNVTVTPKSNAGAVTGSSVDVDSDQTAETFYEGGSTVTPPGGEGGDTGEGGGTVTPPAGGDDGDDPVVTPPAGDTTTASGFYNIGTKENVTTTVKGETGVITSISQDVNADETADTFYPSSDRIEVTYSAASSGSYYGVVLSNGSTVPTKSSDIYYINQATASGTSVTFNVYPMLPTASTDMTLFISSNAQGHTLVSVPLSYAKDATITAPSTPQYELGKVNDDNVVDAADALLVLEFAAKLQTPTAVQELAANVNGDTVIDAADALKILEYAAKLITSWN